jgi:hydrogenase nickel incorporation protein HypA/HybF
MHEQTLVKTLLKQVDEIRCEQRARHVTEVRVEVGPLSGVEPLLLSGAFDLLAPTTTSAGATLVIDEVTILGECKQCDHTFEVVDFNFRCPTCRGNIVVIRGDELQLVSVSLDGIDAMQELAP